MSVVDANLKVYGIENPACGRWIHHAARNDRKYHGSLCDHWRACH